MKSMLCLAFLLCLLGSPAPAAEELLKNGSFTEGEAKWDIEGKAEPSPGGLTIMLDDKKWTLVEQELALPKDTASTVQVKVELTAASGYQPAAESKAYDDVDFGMGGSYGWTARVFPKCDFLVTIRNHGGWEYRPIRLTPGSAQTIRGEFKKMKESKSNKLTLAFPPGSGQVEIKSISALLTPGSPN